MFENLTKKISNIFDKIKGSGVIDDSTLQNVMREIRIALLESDVSLSVAKDFIENVFIATTGWLIKDNSLNDLLNLINEKHDVNLFGLASPLNFKSSKYQV